MSIFGKKAPVEEFAKSLAEDIAKRYPASVDQNPKLQPSANRLTRIIEDACARAVEFKTEHKLGVVGKAKLGNAFRWELDSRGYRKEFIDFATEAIVVHISRKAPGPQA